VAGDLCGNDGMAQPYSDDLRGKLLEAYEAGVGTLQELAQQFRVSFGYSKKIRRQQLQTGHKERPRQLQHGPVSRLTEAVREDLRHWLQEQPDLTEAELRERLHGRGITVCQSRVGQVLREMGLRRKKNRSTPGSATPRRTSNGVKSSAKNSA
jgi:transposase